MLWSSEGNDKRKLEALGKAIIKATKKNATPPDGDYFSGLECNELFLETKYESPSTQSGLNCWKKTAIFRLECN